MAKIKEVYIEAKNSWNFQTFTTGITAEVNSDVEDVNDLLNTLHTVCREKNKERMNLEKAKANVKQE